jgi:hypothetical protein
MRKLNKPNKYSFKMILYEGGHRCLTIIVLIYVQGTIQCGKTSRTSVSTIMYK